jgi:RNA-directed DNA polymerase
MAAQKYKQTLFLYQDCGTLKQKFLCLKEPKDVAELLEVSYRILKYHTDVTRFPKDIRYKDFLIPKKSGKPRIISAPRTPLKILQRKLSQVLYSIYEPKAGVQGFVTGRSIVTNANKHTHKKYVFNIDLKDFFHSIHFGRVQGIFMKPPYNLPKEVAVVLANICCYQKRLPQGAPTSPIVSNMVCARMDSELRRLAQDFKCTYYTRYADDITFSTTLSKFPEDLAFVETVEGSARLVVGNRLRSVIESNGFQINESKVRLQHKSQHQEVTGLTVNKLPNVKRNFVRKISSMLHIWDKFGLESANKKYNERYTQELDSLKDSGYIPPSFKGVASFKDVLRGRINFLGMVKGKDNPTYITYLTWFRELCRRDRASSHQQSTPP